MARSLVLFARKKSTCPQTTTTTTTIPTVASIMNSYPSIYSTSTCMYVRTYVRCATMIDMSDDYYFVILVYIEAIFIGSKQ